MPATLTFPRALDSARPEGTPRPSARKIEELSTRDVRDPRTATALHLACLADAF
ncbi:hypothetical protein ACFZDP_35855 [Streptomyces mirabilis]|uniref:hypothetical protein n=1 Tax=Streptomyces mirabilis TaxID=68239 RepID=UPI0036F0C393